jgi:pyridoxal phosphate enzyme (YggS family)
VDVARNLNEVRNRIYDIAVKIGRDPDEITILGVTKGIEIERIITGIDAGLKVLGENRVQEAESKIPLIDRDVEWHMIGYLQRNKVKKAVKLFDVIQSVDRVQLVNEIVKRAEGRRIKCLIEVNTSGEPQKHGVEPDMLGELFEAVMASGALDVQGLMTVGPYPPEETRSRGAFRLLRELRDRLEKKYHVDLPVLSMGMTEDFEWAILEGATMVRIGRGIFGERNY